MMRVSGRLSFGTELDVRNESQYASTLTDFTAEGFLSGILFQQFATKHPTLTMSDDKTACTEALVHLEAGASKTIHLIFTASGLSDESLIDMYRAIRRREYSVVMGDQSDADILCPLSFLRIEARDSQGKNTAPS
jgi:hypothetical protein